MDMVSEIHAPQESGLGFLKFLLCTHSSSDKYNGISTDRLGNKRDF